MAEAQKSFVATNAVSIAQSKVQPECIPLAMYDGEEPVGFVMYGLDPEEGEYCICRVMTDQKHQSKGYGRRGMELLLERIKEDKDHHKVFISFEPENKWAKDFYESLGFVPDGRIEDGEIVYRLDY